MKNHYVLVVLLLSFLEVFPCTFVLGADRSICKSRNGAFPKPGSHCRSYYRCKNWIPKVETCPENDHFIPFKGYCDFRELYPCLEKPSRKECPEPNGNFLKPKTDCKVYYQCCNGMPTEKQCPKDQLFNPSTQRCEWNELYTCTEKPSRKECPQFNGKFLKPGTGCKVYYHCTNGIPDEKRCQRDLLFNPSLQKCDWPEVYSCIESFSTTSSKSVPPSSTSISTTATSTVTVPKIQNNTTESQLIVETTKLISTSRTEETKTVSDLTEIPTTEAEILTDQTSSPTLTQRSTTTAREILTENTSSLTEKSTEQYLTTATEKNTPVRTNKPDPTGVATSSPTEEPWSTSPSDKDEITETRTVEPKQTESISTEKIESSTKPFDESDLECPEPDGYYPHPYDKHKFIACVNNKVSVFTCPANLVYNHSKRRCDYSR